jgi:hypothetical protein
MAHVEGSGTLMTGVIIPVNVPEPSKVSVVTKSVPLFGFNPTLLAIPRISNSVTPPANEADLVIIDTAGNADRRHRSGLGGAGDRRVFGQDNNLTRYWDGQR